MIKRHERRKVLQLKDRIKKIQEGFMPERPGDAPCERCGFKEICEVKSTLASRFFRGTRDHMQVFFKHRPKYSVSFIPGRSEEDQARY